MDRPDGQEKEMKGVGSNHSFGFNVFSRTVCGLEGKKIERTNFWERSLP
jgi:hypothetical protein